MLLFSVVILACGNKENTTETAIENALNSNQIEISKQ